MDTENWDLFKVLAVLTVVCLVVASLSLIDYSNIANTEEIKLILDKPLELKNWHYALLILMIYISGNK